MLIVTAGSDNYNYAVTIRYTEVRCKEFRYNFFVYDLGGLGFGTPVNDPRVASRFRRVKSAMKPKLIKDTILNSDDEYVVWIDGDAALVKPIDEIALDNSWDIGITVRPKRINKKTHYINAGVIFVRRHAIKFIDEWIEAMPPVPKLDMTKKPNNYSDQQVLEESILLPELNCPLWDLEGQTCDVRGHKVKFFPCKEYNNFWCWKFNGAPGNAKIIHFKGHKMERINIYHDLYFK